jgi:hypothetical protein
LYALIVNRLGDGTISIFDFTTSFIVESTGIYAAASGYFLALCPYGED